MSDEFNVGDRINIVKAGAPYDGKAGKILKMWPGKTGMIARVKADGRRVPWNLYTWKLQKIYNWKKL